MAIVLDEGDIQVFFPEAAGSGFCRNRDKETLAVESNKDYLRAPPANVHK